tara:strand:- start:4786 stop:5826 length:1041 start_codon:yes stop_codon:yes gene_type:complete
MIYILDNGNNFPKLCKTILKWIDKEFKEVVDLEFEYETGDILVMNGEKFTKDYHDGNFIKKVLKDIHIPVVVLIDDSASNWGGTRVELNHNNPVYILSPDVVKSIPKFGVKNNTDTFNYLLTHMVEKNPTSNTLELFESGQKFRRTKYFISLNREKKKHRDYLYSFLKKTNLLNKTHYSYTKDDNPIFLDGDEKWGRNSIMDPTLINYPLHFDSYINIVTLPNGDAQATTDFLDEKIFKPILAFQPFIVLGSPGFLKVLKSFGFQTFFDIFDESYDNIENDKMRYSKVCENIKRISGKYTLTELHNWYYSKEIQQRLKHNWTVAKDLSWEQIDRLKELLTELESSN